MAATIEIQHVKTATLAAAIIVATIVPAFAREMVIVRRSPACLQQQDLSEFYRLARENPSMRQLSDFLRYHQCTALSAGRRVTIEQEDPTKSYFCVRVPQRDRCDWVGREALYR
jgi:hypothetical protein